MGDGNICVNYQTDNITTLDWTAERLRAFEEEVRQYYLQKRIRAPVHLSRGNEHQLIEIFKDIGPHDFVFSTYRSHYHALLKGIPSVRVMEEILAGHSIHLEFPEHRFYSSAIVGGCLPIALGAALGLKRRDSSLRAWCFVGDMAAMSGAFYEAFQYARGFNLPITFAIECNGLATNTPTHQVWGAPHAHIAAGGSVDWHRFDDWPNGAIIRYCYDREWPHYGVGARVNFDQGEQALAAERSDVMA